MPVLVKSLSLLRSNISAVTEAVAVESLQWSCLPPCLSRQVKTNLNHLFPEIIKDWLVKPLRDQHVKPKSKATFKGELFKETTNWKWLKGENEVTPSDKVEITKDGKDLMLTITNCQPDDVSDYTLAIEDRRYTAKLTLGGL